jgi:hypothetical protein
MSRAEWKLIFYDGQRELSEMCVSKVAPLRLARGKKQHHDVLQIQLRWYRLNRESSRSDRVLRSLPVGQAAGIPPPAIVVPRPGPPFEDQNSS